MIVSLPDRSKPLGQLKLHLVRYVSAFGVQVPLGTVALATYGVGQRLSREIITKTN